MRIFLILFKNLSVLTFLVFCFLGLARAQVNITTYKNDNAHTGQNLLETVLTPSVVGAAGSFGLLFNQTVDGQVYAQPLFMSGVTIASKGIHNVVFIATQHDSVYAFDADGNSGANTAPLWHTSFLNQPTSPPPGVFFTSDGASTIPPKNANTSDITVELGITTTPVIDPTTNTLFVVSKTMTVSGSTTTYRQYLHALDIATGQDKIPKQLINPSFSGTGNGSVAGQIAFDPLREHLRSSMLLYEGVIYLSYASHSDQGNYHGLILGYDASSLQFVKSFITTPNGSEGGIWAAGCGPAVDSTGNLFVTTGNGSFDQKNTGGFDWSECFLKLPTTGAFTIADYSTDFFAPNNQAALTSGDVDLGSSGVLLLPDQSGPHPHIMISGGKGDVMYVVDRDILGGNVASGQSDKVVQKVTEPHRLFCSPSYFNGFVYYAPEGGNMLCRQVGYSSATGDYLASTPIKSTETFSAHGSSAFISANGTSNGIVWIINAATPSVLYAYDAAKFSTSTGPVGSIYQFPLVYGIGSSVINDSANKFTLPIVANGKVYLTAYDPPANGSTSTVAHLFVLGSLTAATTAPNAPSQLTAAASSSSQITLSWKDNSTNESGFKILRSSQARGPFSQVGLTGANITTFTDGSLASETDYFYEIVATNNVGDSAPTNVADGTTFQPFTPPGLLSYWNFDEGSGTSVRDVTGHGYNGVLNGEVGFIPGFIGNAALNFHGTGNAVANVTVTDAPSLRFTAHQSFTLSAWVQPAGTRTTDEGVICKSRDTGNYYGVWISASGNHWVFRGPQGDVVGPVASTNWTHVAAVQDGMAGKRYLYINGVLTASGSAQAGDGTGDLWFGQAKSVTEPFPGGLDEVRLYGRALAATEISSLMGPPILQASSRLTQGASGTFDLVLPMDGTVLTEPREGVPAGSYNLVLTFSSPVSGLNALLGLQAGATGATVGTVNAVTYDSTKTVVTVSLGGVNSGQALNLRLSGIEPGNGTADVPLNVLVGDVNGDGVITQADENLVQSYVGQPDTEANFLYDIDGNGEVDAADVAIVTALLPTNPSFYQGFPSAAGLTLNGSAAISNNALQLTTGMKNQAGSAFTSNPVNLQNFTTNFSFQFTGSPTKDADGFTFTIQGMGSNALGSPGGDLGYKGIVNSVAVKFDLYNNSGEGVNSTGVYVNGTSPMVPATDLTSSGIDLHTNDVFNVKITGVGATLTLTVTDATTGKGSFTQSFNLPQPITSIIGGATGYVGFTGGTGGSVTTTNILSWNYGPTVSGLSFGAGFTTLSGLTLNGVAVQSPGTTRLQLTQNTQLSSAASIYYCAPVNIQAFTNTFTFQILDGVADGFTFVIQGEGPNALGQTGGALGYQGIGKSLAVKFDIYNNQGEGTNSVGIYINGAAPTIPATDLTASGIILSAGQLITATVSYSGQTMSLALKDSSGHTFHTTFSVGDLTSIVGGDAAYIGFTAGVGGKSSTQDVINWIYTPSNP